MFPSGPQQRRLVVADIGATSSRPDELSAVLLPSSAASCGYEGGIVENVQVAGRAETAQAQQRPLGKLANEVEAVGAEVVHAALGVWWGYDTATRSTTTFPHHGYKNKRLTSTKEYP